MKKIFISRNLSEDSPIRSISNNHVLVAQSLIEFSGLEFDTPQSDWIFFYSRNGVRYFFEGGNYALHPYLWACISEGTADELANYVQDISFVGSGNPEDVAKTFQATVQHDQVTCFIRAENSVDSVNSIISNARDFSIPVYKNTPSSVIPKDVFDILIFTSPLNAETWFHTNDNRNEDVIAIGNTTAKYLNELGLKKVHIAKTPSEKGIAEILQKLL